MAGYDTLRLILCKKSILVEGDSDELVVQRAYMDTHEGRLPIQDGIDVMSVGGVTFKRYLEICTDIKQRNGCRYRNEQSIRDKFYEINGCIPSNVTIMPWFSLLIRHGIRPYQSYLINNRVSGVLLVNKADKNLLRLKDTNEKKYITASGNVYSNMISKLPCVLDGLSNGCVFRRMRKIFYYVFVDEIQDFAGYDLEVIRKLHQVGCNMTLVGDPRQTTYRTHYETKYKKYAGGRIVNFVQENIPEIRCILI